MARSLRMIAKEIEQDWHGKVNFAARPYLTAMHSLGTIDEDYFNDSAKSVVLYFLSNASSWRGDIAKRVKAELKVMVK